MPKKSNIVKVIKIQNCSYYIRLPKKLVPPELLKVKYYEIELDKERKVLVLHPKPNFKPKPWVIELE